MSGARRGVTGSCGWVGEGFLGLVALLREAVLVFLIRVGTSAHPTGLLRDPVLVFLIRVGTSAHPTVTVIGEIIRNADT